MTVRLLFAGEEDFLLPSENFDLFIFRYRQKMKA